MLPKTAMPSAPPTSRVVSFMAEPTPALASGTALMMLPVAGAAVIAIPEARSTRATARTTYGVSVPTWLKTAMPSPTMKRPRAIVRPLPMRSASGALRGETTMNVAAIGSVARPASSGE